MNEVTGEKVYRVWKTHHNLTNFLPNLIAPNSLKSNYSLQYKYEQRWPKIPKGEDKYDRLNSLSSHIHGGKRGAIKRPKADEIATKWSSLAKKWFGFLDPLLLKLRMHFYDRPQASNNPNCPFTVKILHSLKTQPNLRPTYDTMNWVLWTMITNMSSSPKLEALPVNNGRTGFIVFTLGYPHLQFLNGMRLWD